jgi:hypothetical protein
LFKRGKRRKVWVARWREDVLLESGQLGRLHKSVVLGLVADLPTRRDALTKLEEHIRPVNQGTTRPEAMMSFGVFAETQWSALVLPTLKLSTQHGYKNVLNKHVLPYWRTWRLRDIGKLDVQQFVADKFRQQLGWQTGPQRVDAALRHPRDSRRVRLPHGESCARREVSAAGRA